MSTDDAQPLVDDSLPDVPADAGVRDAPTPRDDAIPAEVLDGPPVVDAAPDTDELLPCDDPTCVTHSIDQRAFCHGIAPAWYHVQPFAETTPLHVVALHQGIHGPDCGGAYTCLVTVYLRCTYRPVILALVSSGPVTWDLSLGAAVTFHRIIVVSPDGSSSVTWALDALPTDFLVGALPHGYCWPPCDTGADTLEMVADLERITGTALTTFQGCYEAGAFRLSHVCE